MVNKIVTITQEQDDYLNENCIKLSAFVRKKLDEEMINDGYEPGRTAKGK